MKYKTFFDLFIDQLFEIYDAEQQIVEQLTHMLKASQSKDLKDFFKNHLSETVEQIKKLEGIFSQLEIEVKKFHCGAMMEILDEGERIIKVESPSAIRDAALIAIAQKAEHYEIATYGTLRTYAKHFKYDDVVENLQEILNEKGYADKALTSLAEGGFFSSGINKEAENLQLSPKEGTTRKSKG